MPATLLDRLRAARDDYETERKWGRFLLDAYCGTGGFAGRIEPPAVALLGWVASAYGIGSNSVVADSTWQWANTYLEQYPREDSTKFARRKDLAHYSNYVESILDLLVSYTLKTAPTREDLPPAVEKWRENVTPSGLSWDTLLRQVIARNAAILGWCPVLLDQYPRPENLSEAAVVASGLRVEPFATPITPANILQWYVDELGVLQWVKVRLDYKRHADPLQDAVCVEKYKILTRKSIASYEVVNEVASSLGQVVHPFGGVPVISFQRKPSAEDCFRGVSMIGDAATAARRLFNLDSELDEHLRSNVFPILQVPVPAGTKPPDEITSGNGNALPVRDEATQGYAFIAPPASVADTYEKRIENTVREIFRRSRLQFRQQGGQTQSGVSKQWDFEETNRLLGDFATNLAAGEAEVYKQIARATGSAPEVVDKIRVIAPTNFAVEDLIVDIEAATEALALDLGPTASKLIKRRLASRMLENASTEDVKAIEDELEKQRKAALAAPAAPSNEGKVDPDAVEEDDSDDAEDEPSDDEGDEPSDAAA